MVLAFHNCYDCRLPITGTIYQVTNKISLPRYYCSLCYNKAYYKGFHNLQVGNTQNIRVPIQTKESEMREATLIYEESIQSYCFQFTKGFNKSVVDIIKAGIPTNERTTTGPPEWKWYFAEKYFTLVKLALEGTGFTIKIITKEDIEKLCQEQAKHQEEAKQYYMKLAGVSIEDELQKFLKLIPPGTIPEDLKPGTMSRLDIVKNWNRETATKIYRKAAILLHPDRNGGKDVGMSELNSTWAILKEGYYIK